MREEIPKYSLILVSSIFVPQILTQFLPSLYFVSLLFYLFFLVFAYYFASKIFPTIKAFGISILITFITWILLFSASFYLLLSGIAPVFGYILVAFINFFVIAFIFTSFYDSNTKVKKALKVENKVNKKIFKSNIYRHLYLLLIDLIILVPIAIAGYLIRYSHNSNSFNINFIFLVTVIIAGLSTYFLLRRILSFGNALSMLIIFPVSLSLYAAFMSTYGLFVLIILFGWIFLSLFSIMKIILLLLILIIILLPHVIFMNFILSFLSTSQSK